MSHYRIDRRGFLAGTASTAVLALGGKASAEAGPKPDRLVVNASGGEMGAAMEQAYGSVFTERTGIPVQMTSPHDLGKLRAMIENGNVEWDVTEVGDAYARIAAKMGLLEPIDDAIVDRSAYPEAARDPHLLTTSVYSTVLAYRKDAFTGEAPGGWADFWNVEKLPGARSLADTPVDNLEFALLADGVAPADLYPLDVERAFAKLDSIRDHIVAWWTSGAQHVQMLVGQEVVLSSAWNGRAFNAVKNGAPLGVAWQGSAIHQAYFGVPRGCPHPHWSQQFLSAMTDPKAQATFANQFVSPGLNPASQQFVDPAVAAFLPTSPDNLPLAFWQDDLWWSENLAPIQERWQRWMLG